MRAFENIWLWIGILVNEIQSPRQSENSGFLFLFSAPHLGLNRANAMQTLDVLDFYFMWNV